MDLDKEETADEKMASLSVSDKTLASDQSSAESASTTSTAAGEDQPTPVSVVPAEMPVEQTEPPVAAAPSDVIVPEKALLTFEPTVEQKEAEKENVDVHDSITTAETASNRDTSRSESTDFIGEGPMIDAVRLSSEKTPKLVMQVKKEEITLQVVELPPLPPLEISPPERYALAKPSLLVEEEEEKAGALSEVVITKPTQVGQPEENKGAQLKLPSEVSSSATEPKVQADTADAEKVVVVTAASRDIGFAVVKGILQQHPKWTVYITSRDRQRGEEAVRRLKSDFNLTAHFQLLDVDSIDSIRQFRNFIFDRHNSGIDVLVNNAGVYCAAPYRLCPAPQMKFDKALFMEIIHRNYFNTFWVCQELFPLLADNAKVIFVSSRFAQLAYMHTTEPKQRLFKQCSTVDAVTCLMELFITTDLPLIQAADGWLTKVPDIETFPLYNIGMYPFGISQLGINLLAGLYQRQFDAAGKSQNNVHFNACCPGLVRTGTNPNGVRTPEEGADSIVWLALQPNESEIKGQFIADRKILDPLVLNQDERKSFF